MAFTNIVINNRAEETNNNISISLSINNEHSVKQIQINGKQLHQASLPNNFELFPNLPLSGRVEDRSNVIDKSPSEDSSSVAKKAKNTAEAQVSALDCSFGLPFSNLAIGNQADETDNMIDKISVTDSGIKKGGRKSSFKSGAKKRKKNENEFMSKSKLRKFLRNTGQEYITKKGKVIKAKIFEDKDCGCSKKCTSKITSEQRQKCFDKFWKMGDFGKQNAYLSGLVTREAVKQHRPRLNCTNRGPKGVTYQYRINVGRVSKQVCKKYFLQTFLVSDGRLSRALRKEENEKEPSEDLRGKKPPANKTSEEQLNRVRDHINKFPRYDCHYTQSSKGKYLKYDLNVKKMYGMYVAQCTMSNIPFVKENIYRSVFNEEFNLTFLSPRRDPCNTTRSDGRSHNASRKKNFKAYNNSNVGFEGLRPPIMQPTQITQPPIHEKFPISPPIFYPTESSKCGYNHLSPGQSVPQDKAVPYNHPSCQAILPNTNPFFSQEQAVHSYSTQTQSFFNL